MGWIQRLYETYNNCEGAIGYGDNPRVVPLLPICHTTQMVQLEITIDGNGVFRRAQTIPKTEARTIIPCSEESGGRTSGEAPHPLFDKLQYVARDFTNFCPEKPPYFNSFSTNLEKWCESDESDPRIQAVYQYVMRGTVMADLVADGVLLVGRDGKLQPKWEGDLKNPPLIFSLVADQGDAFIRWAVEMDGSLESRLWRDKTIWNKWIQYYSRTKTEKSLCYATGQLDLRADIHPAKIRNDGDKAKIISANDSSGFTYRGRFTAEDQVAAVGFTTTQKAHNALRWLISRQGYRKGDQAILAWATNGEEIPKPTDDLISILGMDDLKPDDSTPPDTAQQLALKLKKKIAGYNQKLGMREDVVVMGFDSATPGRLSITYYRELAKSDFLQRLEDWQETCAWQHTYHFVPQTDPKTGKICRIPAPFIGAPAPGDIAEAAYGPLVDDKLRKATVNRILPCIIDGQTLPRDLVESTTRRACNRVGLQDWDWEKTLSIACGLFKKYYWKENYCMSLEEDRTTRDYLYGRLLALAESLEAWALKDSDEKRETTAARLMQRFSEHPFTTWRTIELALLPYKARLGPKSNKRQAMIDEVIAKFKADDFTSDKHLSGEFLLGYHCQRDALHSHSDREADSDTNNQPASE